MFNKILIANRGEIAVRIIHACHELGITAVAVYSEVDRYAMHVREADEAYLIGSASPNESYLKQKTLIEVAKKAGCCAVHPGYGFLAENASFARKVGDSGLVFIGPTPEAIELLGDKVASRQTMSGAGIPIIPGVDKTGLGDKELAKEADGIGYPVLIKAAGGGGGKGMRVVEDPKDFQTSLEAARREAQSAFGNPTVFLEKFLIKPRHIEFQIFGDHFGRHIHLFERECSIQRRHQKIIEETPSPALDDKLRQQMGETAVKVAKAANYINAGTVEFLLDQNNKFYFLEVNTRIQVEHPVTEEVLGVDLVVEQIRVAAGQELSWKQDDLVQRGHAVECRIYAEDAAAGFLPAAGKAYLAIQPKGPGVRYDNGIETGDEVSVYYDPIVAKLVTFGQNRESAIKRAKLALDETVILGFTTNVDFLKDVLDHPEFAKGNIHIGFLPENMPDWKPESIDDKKIALSLGLASLPKPAKAVQVTTDGGSRIPEPWVVIGNWEICGGKSR